jgi:hypothetical protein
VSVALRFRTIDNIWMTLKPIFINFWIRSILRPGGGLSRDAGHRRLNPGRLATLLGARPGHGGAAPARTAHEAEWRAIIDIDTSTTSVLVIQSMCAERERKTKRSGWKSVERERSGERRPQKTMERERSGELRSGNGAESGLSWALKDRSDLVRSSLHRDIIESVPVIDNLDFD